MEVPFVPINKIQMANRLDHREELVLLLFCCLAIHNWLLFLGLLSPGCCRRFCTGALSVGKLLLDSRVEFRVGQVHIWHKLAEQRFGAL